MAHLDHRWLSSSALPYAAATGVPPDSASRCPFLSFETPWGSATRNAKSLRGSTDALLWPDAGGSSAYLPGKRLRSG
jgi:hypothetical protein